MRFGGGLPLFGSVDPNGVHDCYNQRPMRAGQSEKMWRFLPWNSAEIRFRNSIVKIRIILVALPNVFALNGVLAYA
jgi:hypothetical protein